jgi:hypothetical protein
LSLPDGNRSVGSEAKKEYVLQQKKEYVLLLLNRMLICFKEWIEDREIEYCSAPQRSQISPVKLLYMIVLLKKMV